MTQARDSYGDKGLVSGPQPFPLEDLRGEGLEDPSAELLLCWLAEHWCKLNASALEKLPQRGQSSLVFHSEDFWGPYGQKHSVQLHLDIPSQMT